MSGWKGLPDAPVRISSAISTTTDASGYVTIAHGGGSAPVSVQLSGRNTGWEPYLTALSGSTFTVRMLARSNGQPPTSATPASFDWCCYFRERS